MTIITAIFIDGLNLDRGLLQGTPYRWLDPKQLCGYILPADYEITAITYCTAPVVNQTARTEQGIYLKALKKHIPELKILPGEFVPRPKTGVLEGSKSSKPVTIIAHVEKFTDVNLAVHLVNDANRDRFDCAVVISNDSDFAEALRLVKDECRKEVWLLSPVKHNEKPTNKLTIHATRTKVIWPSTLKRSQLPQRIPGSKLHKPKGW